MGSPDGTRGHDELQHTHTHGHSDGPYLAGAEVRPMRAATVVSLAADAVVRLDSVTKVYGSSARAVTALDGVTIGFAAGEFTAVMGPSGSGKTTLLQVAAGIDRPTSGQVRIGDTELSQMSERRLTVLRRRRVGFVFQSFNLMGSLTADPGRCAGQLAEVA